MTTATAIVFEAANQVGFGQFKLAEPASDQIVVETAYTFVSPGTELRVLGGHYGAAGRFPLVPGYSVIGKVVAVGDTARGWRTGDWISGRNPRPLNGVGAMWGGQASRHVYTTTGEDRPVLLPPGCDPFDYVIAETAAIAYRGVEAACVKRGESVVVIGQGIIGAFSAAILTLAGARTAVVDLDHSRLRRAMDNGAAYSINAGETDVLERLLNFLNGGADIVVEASGVRTGVEMAYKLLRRKPQKYGKDYVVEPIHFYGGDWPRLVMQANYLDGVTHNPFGFTPGEGVVILSPSDRGIEDRQRTIELIRRQQLQASRFIDRIVPVSEAPAAYAALQRRECFSVVYDWGTHAPR
jgi:2-desacetyl-2-hydroxyethyl bacteriochlorophyllide A dehydrogenase